MNLVDGTLYADDAAEGKNGIDGSASASSSSSSSSSSTAAVPSAVDTLGRAAALLGLPRQTLRTSDVANIRGGAALLALGAALARPADRRLERTPAPWYAAVAHAGNATTAGRRRFSNGSSPTTRYAQLQAPGRRARRPTGRPGGRPPPASTPQTGQLVEARAARPPPSATRDLECPTGLPCEWDPAPYAQYGLGRR